MLTITGGSRLASFTHLSVRAVKAFHPHVPGPRCLRGSYLRINGTSLPPMNTTVTYPVPENARAVYLYGCTPIAGLRAVSCGARFCTRLACRLAAVDGTGPGGGCARGAVVGLVAVDLCENRR